MRVMPKDDAMRKILKHPTGGKFPEHGSAEWPDDSFTHRRIRDGDVRVVKSEEPKAAAPKTERKKASDVL